jgi:hypothetical protein
LTWLQLDQRAVKLGDHLRRSYVNIARVIAERDESQAFVGRSHGAHLPANLDDTQGGAGINLANVHRRCLRALDTQGVR